MFVFLVAFQVNLLECTSLQDVRDLLRFSIVQRDIRFRISELLSSLMNQLASKIATSQSQNQLSNMDWKSYLLEMDSIGASLAKRLVDGCVIAGSYALYCYMLKMRMSPGFVPGDIDLFCSRSNMSNIMTKLKLRGIEFEDFEDRVYSSMHKKVEVNRDRVKAYLARNDYWYKYDWDELLPTLDSDARSFAPHLFNSFRELAIHSSEEDFPNSNILVSNLIVSSCAFPNREDFAMSVLEHFDMVQCCVAICSIRGTFYPQFVLGPRTSSCIERRLIGFSKSAFRRITMQLSRIRKYQGYGFGLPTHPERIIRLPHECHECYDGVDGGGGEGYSGQ